MRSFWQMLGYIVCRWTKDHDWRHFEFNEWRCRRCGNIWFRKPQPEKETQT